jgi:steroid delta-isomerase-like uncharacterized protein
MRAIQSRTIVRELTRDSGLAAELARMKQGARATWAAGDFAEIARRELWEVGERIVRRVGVRPGEDVLDVACGTGNAAIRAAAAGGRVVGVDLTPELFDGGRRMAAEAGVEVAWVEGDAEALPVADGSFDVVLSTFGCMFAPRHEVAARELARALRPDGRLGFCSWTPEGVMGRFFATMGAYLPPAPAFASPPPLWGSEPHVRRLFAGTGIELEFARESLEPRRDFGSTDDAIAFFTTRFGPLMMARRVTESAGTWPALYEDLVRHFEQDEPAEYLVVLGRKAARRDAAGSDGRTAPRESARSRHEEDGTMATTKEIADRNLAAWQARDAEAFGALYADDAELRAPGEPVLRGPDGARRMLTSWCGAFPDNEITIRAEHVTETTVVQEGTFSGTHTGALPTPDGGEIPPTGRRLTADFVEVFEIADGLIRSDRIYYDQLEIMDQLGLAPDPEAVAAG